MKSRALLVGTLLSLVSFCSLVKMAAGQENSSMTPHGATALGEIARPAGEG